MILFHQDNAKTQNTEYNNVAVDFLKKKDTKANKWRRWYVQAKIWNIPKH